MLDARTDAPAFILGRRGDVLATNALLRALLADFDAMPFRERNLTRWILLDPVARVGRRGPCGPHSTVPNPLRWRDRRLRLSTASRQATSSQLRPTVVASTAKMSRPAHPSVHSCGTLASGRNKAPSDGGIGQGAARSREVGRPDCRRSPLAC